MRQKSPTTFLVILFFFFFREDGELEDGEIDDEGIGIDEENKETTEVKEEKEKEKERDRAKEKEKLHRHSRKRYKKTRDKKRSKKRRHDRPRVRKGSFCLSADSWPVTVKMTVLVVSSFPPQHHSPSSSSSSDSYDSDYDRPERHKTRKSKGASHDPDGPSSQVRPTAERTFSFRPRRASTSSSFCFDRQHLKGSHGNFDKYSDYSDDKYDYDEEEEDYDDDASEYQQSKESSGQGRGRHVKEQMSRGSMRGMKQQQCMSVFYNINCFPMKCLSEFLTSIHFVSCFSSWTERKGKRMRTGKRTRNDQQKQKT